MKKWNPKHESIYMFLMLWVVLFEVNLLQCYTNGDLYPEILI